MYDVNRLIVEKTITISVESVGYISENKVKYTGVLNDISLPCYYVSQTKLPSTLMMAVVLYEAN